MIFAAVAATIAIDAPPEPPAHGPAPRDIVLGTFSVDALTSRTPDGEHHGGGRLGLDMIGAHGNDATRIAAGLRFYLGGVAGFGAVEGQVQLGVAHALHDHAVVALVAPLGFTTAGPDFAFRGYAGLEAVAALGERGRSGGFERFGVELAAEISNRGQRARVGLAHGGKEIGVGIGLLWQRDGDAQLFGLYLAETAGR